MKKILLLLCCSIFFINALAQTPRPPNIAAKSWLLLDMTSNQIIASDNPTLRVEPASLAKIMTSYLVFQALRDKKLSLSQTVNVSVAAWKVDKDSSKMFIDPKTPVTINDLLYGLVVQSGNDASVALAEAVAGSDEAFAELMNREAKRMGLKDTHFANSHGLPSAQNYTTAQDLARIAQLLVTDFPDDYKTFYATKSFKYNNITQPNRNRLLWLDATVDGMKTGHTSTAGYCLVSSAVRPNGSGDRRLIAVVVGTNSDQVRSQESLKLLNWGFLNFDTVKLYEKGQAVATPEVWKGSRSAVKIGFTRDLFVTLPKGTAAKLKPQLERKDPLVAPIEANTQIGTMSMMLDGKPVAQFSVMALETVGQASIFGRAWDAMRLWFKSS